MTKQEIFDAVARGIIAQGGGSYEEASYGVACRYRNPNGRKCAAGLLIPDELYSPHFEGASFSAARQEYGELAAVGGGDSEFIVALQRIHDLAATTTAARPASDEQFMESWRYRMRDFAQENYLDASALAQQPEAV